MRWMTGWRWGALDPLASLLALSPCLPFSLTALEAPSLTAPSPGAALSHTPFPAILHQCDKRTMGLPAALPWSRWSHRALTQGRLDPRKEGVQMLAPRQGLSEGDMMRKMAYGLVLPSGRVHRTAPQHPPPQLLSGYPFIAQLTCSQFQFCHLTLRSLSKSLGP